MRLIEPIGQAALASRRRFRAQQPMQQLGRGGRLTLGAVDLVIEGGGHAVEAQLGDQGLQLVTHRRRSPHRD
jgi:hypothetical protein